MGFSPERVLLGRRTLFEHQYNDRRSGPPRPLPYCMTETHPPGAITRITIIVSARLTASRHTTHQTGKTRSYYRLELSSNDSSTRHKKSVIYCLLLLFPQAGAGGGRGVVDLAP